MSNSVHNAKYININTDFGYDALGGVGKTGRLGNREAEVLPAPTARQSTRIPGPPKTAGRWFAKLLDALTPAKWRTQGKFKRGLEDFSAQTGRILGQLHNSFRNGISDTEKQDALSSALKELASLRQTAKPVTSRGTDYQELLSARLQVNIQILKQEHPELLARLQQIKTDGNIDEIIESLDPQSQSDIIEDLTVIKNSLSAVLPEESQEIRNETVQNAEIRTDASEEEKPRTPPFSLQAIKEFFLDNFTVHGKALKELQANQGQLSKLTDEAKQLLQESLQEIQRAGENISALDAEELSRIQHGTEDKLKKAVQFAMNNVCDLAFRHLDSRETIGSEGKDYTRITADFVKAQLDTAESGTVFETDRTPNVQSQTETPQASADQAKNNPFADAVQTAKGQIQEISELYGEISETVAELKDRAEKYACAVFLNNFPMSVSTLTTFENMHEVCKNLIDALQTGNFDPAKIRRFTAELELQLRGSELDDAQKQELQAMLPKIKHALNPEHLPAVQLSETSQAAQTLKNLEQLKTIHQIIGNAGALLQQSKLPQADMLTAQALQISRQFFKLQTTAWNYSNSNILQMQIQDMQSTLSRFTANLALARMQTENPAVRSAQPHAKNLDSKTAQDGFMLIQRSLKLLADKLTPEQGKTIAAATLGNGALLMEKGLAAAKACARLQENRFNKETEVAEQLAVCLESGRSDADTALQNLIAGKKWDKGKHLEAKNAIQEFLSALAPVNAGRLQNRLLAYLSEKISNGIVPHDLYRGFDGSYKMLINTDQQTMLGDSKKIQGTKWITLPSPESLTEGKISTGVHRFDGMLRAGDNLTRFYPTMYAMLTDYFDGKLYDTDFDS